MTWGSHRLAAVRPTYRRLSAVGTAFSKFIQGVAWSMTPISPRPPPRFWNIPIRKHRRNPDDFDTVQLARASDGLTGSEIEAVFVESLYEGFDREAEPTDLDIARVLTEFVPLSKTMAEQITALRTWAKGRARFATSPAVSEPRLRKLAA